jgi:hypothetical protein
MDNIFNEINEYTEGAVCEFLSTDSSTNLINNRLAIIIGNPTVIEKRILGEGKIECGILEQDGSILFLWRFSRNGKQLLLETPFNASQGGVSTELVSELIKNEKPLSFKLQIIDPVNKEAVGNVSSISLKKELTHKFYSSVINQLSINTDKEEVAFNPWMFTDLNFLMSKTKMYRLRS